MKFKMILAVTGLLVLAWYATTGFTSQVNGGHTGSSLIHVDVPSPSELPDLGVQNPDPAPAPVPAPPPEPAPAPEPEHAPEADQGGTNTSAGTPGSGIASTGSDLVDSVKDWATGAWDWAQKNALWIMLVVIALAVIAALGKRSKDGPDVTKDPQRMYTSEQRTESFARAGGQCEYLGWGFMRCRSQAEHADHFFPHSKGGATSLLNCVASCAHHNTSKGAKVLPKRQGTFLKMRRRRYYPAGIPVDVGEVYDPSAVSPEMLTPIGAAESMDEAIVIDEPVEQFITPADWGDIDFSPSPHASHESDDIHEMYR